MSYRQCSVFVYVLAVFSWNASGCGRTGVWYERQSTLEGNCPMALELDFQGVWTNPNAHSKVPAGAAKRAENIVNPRPGVAECVPGQQNLPGGYEEADERFSSGTTYQGKLVESTSGGIPRLYWRDTVTPSLNPYNDPVFPPDGVVRMPFAEAGEKLYMATSEGVKVIDGVTSEPAPVGLPAPFPPNPLTSFATGKAFEIADGSSIAYRSLYLRSTSGADKIISVPSGRAVLTNGDGQPQAVNLTQFLTAGVAAGDTYRLYRTGEAVSSTEPGDVMFLVYEYVLTSADITAGYITISDVTPDELRGAPLYTNANQEGIVRQNERPPLAKALIAFDDTLMLGNVQGSQRFTFRMLAVPAIGDTLTIAGQTYTAAGTGDYPNGIFAIAGGTVSEAIMYTSRNLVDAINRKTANTSVYAAYVSTETDPPGIIEIEGRDVTVPVYTVVASNGVPWEPQLATATSSQATTEPNGIWVSKRGQHYAFPPLRSSTATYRFRVGVKGGEILAMAAIKDAVIVFVEKEGVFKVKRTGAESWRVDQINANANLLVPGSVVVVDNQALALTARGLVAVDEGGVEEIDLPIKDKMDEIKALDPELLRLYSFAVGDEGRLRYVFYHPIAGQTGETPGAFHAWVYNADQGTWTERTDPAFGGMVGADDGLLYLGPDDNALTQERTGTPAQIFKNPDNSAIPFRLEWTVKDEGDPGAQKQFTEMRLLTRQPFTGDVTFNCTNDLGGTESTTASTGAAGEPFVMSWVPDGCQRTSRLDIDIQRDVLGEAFEVVGMKTTVAGMYDGQLRR